MRSSRRGSNGSIEALTLTSTIDVAQLGASRYVLSVRAGAEACAVKDVLYPLAAHDGASIVVDLQTSVLDPSLLGILMGGAHLVRSAGGEFVVVARSPRVRWVLDDCDFASVARVERTLNDALETVA